MITILRAMQVERAFHTMDLAAMMAILVLMITEQAKVHATIANKMQMGKL